jgi:hypothetical protein
MAFGVGTLKFREFIPEPLDFLHVLVYNMVCCWMDNVLFFGHHLHVIVYISGREKGKPDMGTYSLEALIRKWGLSELTTEQAIGQILLILQGLVKRVEALEGRGEIANRRRLSRKG